MKALLVFSFLFSVLGFTQMTMADDSISVEINGKSYTCSGAGSVGHRAYCECQNYSNYYGITLRNINFADNSDTWVKNIAADKTWTLDKAGKAACEKAIANYNLCDN